MIDPNLIGHHWSRRAFLLAGLLSCAGCSASPIISLDSVTPPFDEVAATIGTAAWHLSALANSCADADQQKKPWLDSLALLHRQQASLFLGGHLLDGIQARQEFFTDPSAISWDEIFTCRNIDTWPTSEAHSFPDPLSDSRYLKDQPETAMMAEGEKRLAHYCASYLDGSTSLCDKAGEDDQPSLAPSPDPSTLSANSDQPFDPRRLGYRLAIACTGLWSDHIGSCLNDDAPQPIFATTGEFVPAPFDGAGQEQSWDQITDYLNQAEWIVSTIVAKIDSTNPHNASWTHALSQLRADREHIGRERHDRQLPYRPALLSYDIDADLDDATTYANTVGTNLRLLITAWLQLSGYDQTISSWAITRAASYVDILAEQDEQLSFWPAWI